MEHRINRRIECSIDARLSYRDTVIPNCNILNANTEGVLISTVDLELPKLVLVKLVIKDTSIQRTVGLRPLVVHSSIGHAGLWFYKDREKWESLWRTLNNAEELCRQFDSIQEDHHALNVERQRQLLETPFSPRSVSTPAVNLNI